MIGGIFAGLKALSVVSKVSGALSFIPGVGVLPGIVSAVCGAILGFVRILFQGLTVIVTNPATIVTVGVIALGSMAWGVKMGHEWTGRRVEAANARVSTMEKSWKEARDANAKDLDDALEARRRAEQVARDVEKASKDAAVRAGRATVAERVRNQPASPAAPAQSGWSLSGLPKLFKGD